LLLVCKPGEPAWADSLFAVYLAIFFLRVGWTHVGYSVGVKAIDKVRENSQMIARSATILGITVIGGLIASYVHINVATTFAIDDTHSVALQKTSSTKSSQIFCRWPIPC
jgi:mannose/fructose/N-acetylgalactosamine-specific phosphotransferase system component IID